MARPKLSVVKGGRSANGAGLWRLTLLTAVTGFGLVSLWANFGNTLEGAWRNIVQAIGVPRVLPQAVETILGRASVVDGDTIEIHGTRIRFFGIDAPEGRQTCTDRGNAPYPCGQRAAFALADKIGGRSLACEVVDQDRYGRSVATCRLGNLDLNDWMVSSGWALAYTEYSSAYVDAQAAAQTAELGIWEGRFTPPWEWRRMRDAPAKSAAPVANSDVQPGCTIKGNISSDGERIFHGPGQEYYSRTLISPAKGERWFCSEAEAMAAGWRPSKR